MSFDYFDHFDRFDDANPPRGDVDAVVARARRRTAQRRLGAGALTLALLTGVTIAAAASRDGGGIDVGPATTPTTAASTTPAVTWSAGGIDYRFTLLYPEAVVGGEVRAALELTNVGPDPVDIHPVCGDEPFAIELHAPDGTPLGEYGYDGCLPTTAIAPGTHRFDISTGVGDLEPSLIGTQVNVVLVGAGDGASLVVEIVAPTGRAEYVYDSARHEVTLVVHNDTDALLPFPGPGEMCPELYIQSQLIVPGTEPAAFAWPGVECEPEPVPLLEPGRNEVVTSRVVQAREPGTFDLIADIGYAWDAGIDAPGAVVVTVD